MYRILPVLPVLPLPPPPPLPLPACSESIMVASSKYTWPGLLCAPFIHRRWVNLLGVGPFCVALLPFNTDTHTHIGESHAITNGAFYSFDLLVGITPFDSRSRRKEMWIREVKCIFSTTYTNQPTNRGGGRKRPTCSKVGQTRTRQTSTRSHPIGICRRIKTRLPFHHRRRTCLPLPLHPTQFQPLFI